MVHSGRQKAIGHLGYHIEYPIFLLGSSNVYRINQSLDGSGKSQALYEPFQKLRFLGRKLMFKHSLLLKGGI